MYDILKVFATVFLVLILLQWNRKNQLHRIKHIPLQIETSSRVAVLLTMCANTPQKVQMYSKVLRLWLDNTSLQIYTVDSSGSREFSQSNSSRWKPFSFTQGSTVNETVSTLEIKSIEHAANFFKDEWANLDLIVKITCKYFLPDFEQVVKRVPKPTDLLVQHSCYTRLFNFSHQNSELLGIQPSLIPSLITFFRQKTWNLENSLSEFRGKHTFRLPLLQVSKETRYSRAIGDYLTKL